MLKNDVIFIQKVILVVGSVIYLPHYIPYPLACTSQSTLRILQHEFAEDLRLNCVDFDHQLLLQLLPQAAQRPD